MLAEYQTITSNPLPSNQIIFQGELKALWVMSSKEKTLQYFKNQVTGNVLQSFQHFKSDSPEIPTRMVLGGNVTQPFALHIKKNFFEERKKSLHPQTSSNARGEKREVQRDCETAKTYHIQNLPWKKLKHTPALTHGYVSKGCPGSNLRKQL